MSELQFLRDREKKLSSKALAIGNSKPESTRPCTLENLAQVNVINYAEKPFGALELRICDGPSMHNPQCYVVQFAPEGQQKPVTGFSLQAHSAVINLLRVTTGDTFVIGYSFAGRIIYLRRDLAEQIATYEQ